MSNPLLPSLCQPELLAAAEQQVVERPSQPSILCSEVCWGVTAGSALSPQAAQLEALAARLAARSKCLLHGAAAYRQGLCAMSEGFAALAERLHKFCGGADDTSEESMSVGAPWEGFCACSCPCAARRCLGRSTVLTLAPRQHTEVTRFRAWGYLQLLSGS